MSIMKSTTPGSPEELYSKYMAFHSVMLEKHRPLEIAAIMMTQALSIYRTILSEEEYQKMVDNISDLRDQVKTFEGTGPQ